MNTVTTTFKLTSADFGSIFQTSANDYTIFAQVGPDIGAFICLSDGNRYFEPLPIEEIRVPEDWVRVKGVVQIEVG
jgi:hypothetical protein